MATRTGILAVVKQGGSQILGIGKWVYTAPAPNEMNENEFGDKFEKTKHGIKTGGTISFEGLGRGDSTAKQEEMRQAWLANTELTNLRFYEDNTSYLEACQTTGYFSPSLTTGANSVSSHIKITNYSFDADMNNMLKINFTGKVNGLLVEI
jgi:hypothetical protein